MRGGTKSSLAPYVKRLVLWEAIQYKLINNQNNDKTMFKALTTRALTAVGACFFFVSNLEPAADLCYAGFNVSHPFNDRSLDATIDDMTLLILIGKCDRNLRR